MGRGYRGVLGSVSGLESGDEPLGHQHYTHVDGVGLVCDDCGARMSDVGAMTHARFGAVWRERERLRRRTHGFAWWLGLVSVYYLGALAWIYVAIALHVPWVHHYFVSLLVHLSQLGFALDPR